MPDLGCLTWGQVLNFNITMGPVHSGPPRIELIPRLRETPDEGEATPAMNPDSAPKTAYELAMERLRKKDEDAGVSAQALTAAQREAIAEARRVAESKVAEAQIMHRSRALALGDPGERAAAEEALRRDIQRIREDCDRKVEKIRSAR